MNSRTTVKGFLAKGVSYGGEPVRTGAEAVVQASLSDGQTKQKRPLVASYVFASLCLGLSAGGRPFAATSGRFAEESLPGGGPLVQKQK